MKKIKTVFTAIVMLLTTAAFAANGDNVSEKVKAAFKTDFAMASQVTWEKNSDFYFASFMLNQVKVDAAYNEDGELVGTSRKISTSALPLTLSLELSKKFGDHKISATAYELNYEGQTSYYLSAQNSKQVVNLKCNANGEIETESRTKK